MSSVSSIQYLRRHQIDKQKWDECISKSANGLIYAYTEYLDAMADNWDAVVIGEYAAVMPLTWRKKYFIRYLYQPFFAQQLGFFFTSPISNDVYPAIEQVIKKHFRFAEINMNYCSAPSFFADGLSLRVNYLLDINKPYQDIATGYENGFVKNLRRATNFQLEYSGSTEIGKTVGLYRELYGVRFPQIKPKDYQRFENLCNKLQQVDKLVIRQVKAPNGELMAIALLLIDDKRIYNLISCNTAEGRKLEANYYLYDRLINEFCNQRMLLDMEGSEIKGIADFYRSLGCISQPYSFVKYNQLVWPLRLFK
jgi:Acetyltransferase (GNAT) domain